MLELRNVPALVGRTITLRNRTFTLNIRSLCFFPIKTLAVSVWEVFMLKLVLGDWLFSSGRSPNVTRASLLEKHHFMHEKNVADFF